MADGFGHLRVAVVDDDPLIRDLLCRALLQLSITDPQTAADGAGALELLEQGPLDVLFCDLNMPGMDGIELLRHLAARSDAPALAMVSGDAHILRIAAELGHAHRLRVLGTIPKPATPDALREVLERLDASDGKAARPITASTPLGNEDILALLPSALELHYQPQVDLATGLPVAVESLARLRHSRAGLLGPELFVPLCEQRGMSFTLTRMVVRRSIEQVAAWRAAGLPLRICVNVSADDLEDISVVGRLEAAAIENGVPLDAITLELTESRILAGSAGPLEVLSRFRLKGVGLSIDDFGTGFSTLEQLRRIPFNELKIDQSFVANSTTDPRAATMLRSTVGLARELGLTTVAEGVETQEQLELVTALGCDLAQGYHLARPMAVDGATQWLQERLLG